MSRDFKGFSEFVELLGQLLQRPRRGEIPRKERGADRRWGIPFLCLVRDQDSHHVLSELREYLRHARPDIVPYAEVGFEADERAQSAAAPEVPSAPPSYTDLNHVAVALFDLARKLSSGPYKMRFPRFELARWLMKQRPDGDGEDDQSHHRVDRDAELARRIRVFRLSRWRFAVREVDPALSNAPWWIQLLARLPSLLFPLRRRLGASYRWFLRQSNLSPHDPGTFLGFTQRLTGWLGEPEWRRTSGEPPEELLGLLVNAFLEDVRRAYRRRWWRPRAARRTTYVVILLDRITRRNGGYRLLETVNRVRNETGLFDPLLFISGSEKVPPEAFPPGKTSGHLWELGNAESAYGQWRRQFGRASRAGENTAWYLAFQCERADDAEPAEPPPVDTLLLGTQPWWSRVWALFAVCLVVGLAALAGTVLPIQAFRSEHCGLNPWDSGADYLVTIDDQCIGASAEPTFGEPEELLAVQRVITDQNADAERLRSEQPGREFVTVAYVSEMSTTGQIVPSEVERLQGLAARQWRQLRGSEQDPLVRILFVNAGNRMEHGEVAAAMLEKLMRADPTIVGAVGLAVSSEATKSTIRALGAAGIPMVAATLTADDIEDASAMYHQISPQNWREAKVAARYARHHLGHTESVIVVSSGNPADLYDTTLAEDALQEFDRVGLDVELHTYRPTASGGPERAGRPDPRELGHELCGTESLLFYTGRPADFKELVEGINNTCGSSPPAILAGDDISRFIADARWRERFPQIPYDSMALALGGQDCRSETDLSNALRELFPNSCPERRNSYLTDGAAVAYDSLSVVVSAVNRLHEENTAVNAGAVWHMITKLTGQFKIDGVSGLIDFGPRGSQIPQDKFIAVMRVEHGGAPKVQAICGQFRDWRPARWCP